jgi:hypothetical protein
MICIARAAASSAEAARPHWPSPAPNAVAAELDATLACHLQRRLSTLADQAPFLLGQRGIEVKHERIRISAQFGDDERYPLDHQPADEMHVAAKPVELCHHDGVSSDRS